MSQSVNLFICTGNLGKDPDIRYTPQGTPVTSFPLAVNNRKKVDGEWKDEVMWFKVKVWGKAAESVSQYLSKGRPCHVIGRLGIETWTNKEQKEVTTFVIDNAEVKFLGDGGQGAPTDRAPRASTAPEAAAPAPDISDDDIPF